ARDALGHSIPTGDAAAIIERGLDLVSPSTQNVRASSRDPSKSGVPAAPTRRPARLRGREDRSLRAPEAVVPGAGPVAARCDPDRAESARAM
ncbi:MAG TPA: hypothetical protein VD838_06110, partial [Anaeromyxobacteraceae bacterium]|nr:hypothetical protein [Anaeromyxobacteraceae bacterium]